ncbi:putative aquaporin PIP-type pTOM75-like protein isoform 1 [Tanacetum coccineum]
MFHNLSLVESEELLSVSWLSKLLDVFLSCQEQFRVILSKNKSNMNKQALERSISDYFERSVKSLDVCNAIRDGIDQMWAMEEATRDSAIPCRIFNEVYNSVISFQKLLGVPILSLQEKILEESKKRDRKNSCGLLKEIHGIEMFAHYINRVDSFRFPIKEEHEEQVLKRFEELRIVFESLENGLDPLERQVRNVFHQIVRCRIEGIDLISRTRD